MDWFKLVQFLLQMLPGLLDAILKLIKGVKGQSLVDAPIDAEAAIDDLIAGLQADKARVVAAKAAAAAAPATA